MISVRLRRWALALMALDAVVVVFSLLGTTVVRLGLPPPAVDVARVASVAAQANMMVAAAATLLIVAASESVSGAVALFVLSVLVGGATEWLCLSTGLPFGRYVYTDLLGLKFGGMLPALVPVAWFTACGLGLHLARRLTRGPTSTVTLAASLVTLWDLVLDPAMTTGFAAWRWLDSGPYYGIPARNFVAWFLTAALILGLYTPLSRAAWRRDESSLGLWLYLLQGALPGGLSLIYGRAGATLLWGVGVGALVVVLARAGGRTGGERT